MAATAARSASSSVVVRSIPTSDKDLNFLEPLSENTIGLDDSAFVNLDGNATLNQGETSSEEEEDLKTSYYNLKDSIDTDDSKDDSKDDANVVSIQENEEERETASDDSDSKDDSKDDSRVEIPCSAPSPEQEKDGKNTKVVNEPNTPSSGLGTLSERLREYDSPYRLPPVQKLMEEKMVAEYEKTHEMVKQFRELTALRARTPHLYAYASCHRRE